MTTPQPSGEHTKVAVKLANLLKNVPGNEVEGVVRDAHRILDEEKWKRRERCEQSLMSLFTSQIATLRKKKYAEACGMPEKYFLKCVEELRQCIYSLVDPEAKKGRIPFLIVIPRALVSLPKQLSLLEINGKRVNIDRADAMFGWLRNLPTVNQEVIPDVVNLCAPYLAVDVDDGSSTTGLYHGEARKLLKEEGHNGLTTEEGIALTLHYPRTLLSHDVYLLGSIFEDHGEDGPYVPTLGLNPKNGEPVLYGDLSDSDLAKISAGSCARRILH